MDEKTSVGTIASGSGSCVKCGNIVIASLRYDATTNASLVTGLPKAKFFSRSTLVGQSLNACGAIQINEAGTTIDYINLMGSSNVVKYGQLVYIADE